VKANQDPADHGAFYRLSPGHTETEVLASIASLLHRISSGEKVMDVASRAIEFVARLSGADFGALVIPELDYTYRIVDALGSVDHRTPGLEKKMSYTPVSRVLQGGERVTLVSVANQTPGSVDDWLEAERLVDVILEPLVTRMGTKGLLAVGFRKERPELRGASAEESFAVSAVKAVGALLSLAIESQEIVEAARTQAYHAELLNVLLSKARRLGTVEEMLSECLQTLARGLGTERGVACIVTASPLEMTLKTSPESLSSEPPYKVVAELSQESGGAKEDFGPSATSEWVDKAALDACRRLLEISQGARPAHGERPRGGMVAIFTRGKLGDNSPPAFWVGFVPAAGRPSFVMALRPDSGPELSSAEMRLLQRVAEEFSHYLSYAGAFAAEREAVRRLTDLDRTKSELLGVVSHELRTPLTSIRGFTSSLLEGVGSIPEDKQRRFLSIIDSQAERLSKLIDDFLDMSRLQEGALVLEISRFDLVTVCARIAEQYASQAQEKGMSIRFERSGVASAVVQADESKVDQIVTNLVSNAIKYGEGTVTLGITQHEDGVRVWVEDEGPGVPEEKRRDIFDRFVQADTSSTRRSSGVGLGLAIAKGLAEAHGGALWYEPRHPRGARFTLFLPLIAQPATGKIVS
jgi:signal transduction histidine kinase